MRGISSIAQANKGLKPSHQQVRKAGSQARLLERLAASGSMSRCELQRHLSRGPIALAGEQFSSTRIYHIRSRQVCFSSGSPVEIVSGINDAITAVPPSASVNSSNGAKAARGEGFAAKTTCVSMPIRGRDFSVSGPSQSLDDCGYRIPIARRTRNTDEFLHPAEITDCFHVPFVKTE